MGTKLQPAIDILAIKSIFIATEIRDSMERAFEQRSVEAVKTTMLKQDEIFKQQVRELHRLYSVQRMLMDELKNEIKRQSKYYEKSGSCSGGESKIRINAKGSGGLDFDIIRRSDHQEDNSTGVSITAVEAAAGPSSSSNMIMPGSSRIVGGLEEDFCGVDLTLSLGGGRRKRLQEYQPYQCKGLGCSESQDQNSSLGTMRSSKGTPPKITLDQGEEKRAH